MKRLDFSHDSEREPKFSRKRFILANLLSSPIGLLLFCSQSFGNDGNSESLRQGFSNYRLAVRCLALVLVSLFLIISFSFQNGNSFFDCFLDLLGHLDSWSRHWGWDVETSRKSIKHWRAFALFWPNSSNVRTRILNRAKKAIARKSTGNFITMKIQLLCID